MTSVNCFPVLAIVLVVLFPSAAGQKKNATAPSSLNTTAPTNQTFGQQLEQQIMEQLGLPPLPSWKPTPVPDPAEQSVLQNSTRFHRGIFECPCSPSNRSDGSLPAKDLAEIRNGINKTIGISEFQSRETKPLQEALVKVFAHVGDVKKAIKGATSALTRCRKVIRFEGCVNADARLRGKVEPPFCSYDKTTKRNVFAGKTVGSCAGDARFNQSKAQIQAAKLLARATGKQNRNEGCVAAEHLQGYVLQHANHLLRPVLCYRGFCATPNHAIFVDDNYTSMSRKCAQDWKCKERVMLVNNLKVAANRRVKVFERIVITPYDIRFPKAAVWFVQMLEDVWSILAMSVCSGTFAGAFLLLYSKKDKKA